jgi:hypothetical protein
MTADKRKMSWGERRNSLVNLQQSHIRRRRCVCTLVKSNYVNACPPQAHFFDKLETFK